MERNDTKAAVRAFALSAMMAVGLIAGRVGPVVASGPAGGIVEPPAIAIDQPPPQSGLPDISISIVGRRILGQPEIVISNIGTRDSWAFTVQEVAGDQFYSTQLPGIPAGASVPFPDHLFPKDCNTLTTIFVPKTMPELRYDNNQIRFTPYCDFVVPGPAAQD